ncbi:MAG: cobalamin biosynthesis protein CobD [Lachnospiraceae bacterium]|nr:cobalamin biosynthesis protein CobD [Lachnospiraceae bacterium]
MEFICITGLISIIAGYILDLIIGDPYSIPHPVVAIGKLVAFCTDKLLCKDNTVQEKRRNGLIMVIIVECACAVIPLCILYLVYRLDVAAGIVIESIMCWQILAAKSLKTESTKVEIALEENDIEKARFSVSMIVGRDTTDLDAEGITKAAVETVAENSSDGVIAPLFYMFFGGAVTGFLYKGINTMDSMAGYKNEKYIDFGRAAAKLDDIANFIPARISAFLMVTSAFILGYDAKNAWKIFVRDRYKSTSPNSGQTESVCAGALNIELLGDAYYFGKLVKKPSIGDAIRDIEPYDIHKANNLMYCMEFLMVIFIILLKSGFYFFFV